jgi:hypothetical protein
VASLRRAFSIASILSNARFPFMNEPRACQLPGKCAAWHDLAGNLHCADDEALTEGSGLRACFHKCGDVFACFQAVSTFLRREGDHRRHDFVAGRPSVSLPGFSLPPRRAPVVRLKLLAFDRIGCGKFSGRTRRHSSERDPFA